MEVLMHPIRRILRSEEGRFLEPEWSLEEAGLAVTSASLGRV